MGQRRDETTQHLAERWCWEVARRDDARVARRLDRQQEVEGVDRLDEGAVLADFFHLLQVIGLMPLLEAAHGAAIQRELVPDVQDVRLYGLQTLCGIERIHAWPSVRFSDAAWMPWGGCNARQVRQGSCQRGAAKRPAERAPGPMCPATLAKNIVKWHWRDLEAVCKGALRALAKAGVFGAKVTGLVEGTALQTTAHSRGCGWTTRQVRLEETHGQRHGIESTVYGWKVLRLIEAVTKMPLAVTVGQMRAHEVLWARAWVTQARRNRTGAARLAGVVFDRGCWDGPTLWWLDQQGLRCVGPAKTTRAVPAAARAQAAADAGISIGRRVQTIRPGQGKTAWTARQATEVGG